MREPARNLIQYAAGSRVPQTGIYIFQHNCSRPPEDVIAVRGQRLPSCVECSGGGEYLLKFAAPRPDEDPDFQREQAA
jgi:hypothetical protein